ncbi:glutamate-tRNA ligase [Rhodotorula diobovata]|uniref:glutamate--tRNA ligase n=1 Tax=Rhodotorula diobovata TaxID=5288 RepID=A0A5C5FLH1_9BASI|nr:glutamate-tRNA ligase [Rhodotorula diobovata]
MSQHAGPRRRRRSPQPIAVVAFAYSLPPSTLDLEWVHSLPAEAKGANCQLDINGTSLYGTHDVLNALGDAFAGDGALGNDSNESAQVHSLLSLPPPFPPAFPTATAFLASLEQRLTLRTYAASNRPTLADYALFGALKTNVIALSLVPKAPHTQRWFNHVAQLPAVAKALVDVPAQAKVKPAPASKSKAAKGDDATRDDAGKANATFELGLPNAIKGQVVTRLPPEPSGYLHIGHAKAAVLNQYFARMYEGKFLVRFDDTNPSKEKAEFEQSIIEDLALLGIKADATSYTSDYFDQLQQYCVQMIKLGKAYADDTEQEVMRQQRMDGIASARRDLPVDESLARFADMATASPEGKRWCIRAKMSVDDPNKALRDPVIYRVNDLAHHRTGTRWKVYPTYDFACPVVDSLEGVTHALRTNEYRDRNPQYQWMLDALGLRRVDVWDFGRLAFVYTLLSKRKLKWFVEEGHVSGWDDPRFPTVRGIRRRGMTVEAITQFMLQQGPSQAFLNLEWDSIWNTNKRVIDPVAPRHVALEQEGLVPVTIRGGEGKPAPGTVETREVPRHKKNPAVGTKTTFYADRVFVEQADAASFAQDEEVTLMDWGNAIIRSISRDASSNAVTALEVDLNLAGDFKKTKKKVTWLAGPKAPSSADDLVKCTLLDYDYLITKKKLEEDDSVEALLTPKTEFRTAAVADHNVASLAKGTILQFERKGFYIVDRAFDPAEPAHPVELILIPDGKASSIALKYQPPAAAAAPADKGKKGKTPAKDKAAAVAAGQAQKAKKGALPDVAPTEAVETVLLSEGDKGYSIPVKTKMYKVPNPHGHEAGEVFTKTDMYKVKPVNE